MRVRAFGGLRPVTALGAQPREAGIAGAVDLVVSRPARLGSTRLVAVDGPSGSGKTSLSRPLAAALADRLGGAVVVPERVADGARGPAAAAVPAARGPSVTVVSTDLLATWEQPLDWWPVIEEHLFEPIARGVPAILPVVQWVSGNPRPGGYVTVPPADVLVLEGVSSGRVAVTGRLSALVWVEVPDRAARLERAVGRDGEAMRQFLAQWQLDEDDHFRRDATRSRADIVIDPSLEP